MNLTEKHQIRLLLLVALGIALTLWFLNDNIFEIKVDSPTQVTTDNFTKFALIISIVYEMIPSVAKQFYSTGAISIKLLTVGFSPLLLGVLLGLGQLAGQMILYTFGLFVHHVRKGSIGNLAGKSHFFHQHHFLIYLIVPFAGVLGDAVMIYSGHERINPVKMIPFLLVSNIADNYKWIYTQLFNLEVSDSFG